MFFVFRLGDLRISPLAMKAAFGNLKLAYLRFRIRKTNEEKSLFFQILFLPPVLVERYINKRRAGARGITLTELYEEQIQKNISATQKLRLQLNLARINGMGELADFKPGATVNDWEALIERRPILSLRYLSMSLKRWF